MSCHRIKKRVQEEKHEVGGYLEGRKTAQILTSPSTTTKLHSPSSFTSLEHSQILGLSLLSYYLPLLQRHIHKLANFHHSRHTFSLHLSAPPTPYSQSRSSGMTADLASSPLLIRPSIFVPVGRPASILNWNRCRLKLTRWRSAGSTMTMSIPIEKLFHGIISVFPSVNSLELIVPALGFVSGTALYLSSSRRRRRKEFEEEVVENWILFSSPTPFNRSVLLRCPSLLFEDGGELLDGVNERLVEEGRHIVRFDRGNMVASREDGSVEDEVQYQRVCVSTDDGGVIAIDWPENLELEKEHGLDATLLLVPGTTEGSSDRAVRFFASEALRYGYFPIVMNPRGCAGSPVITPRLFTAADSEDIGVAVRFIKRSRPWTTLMCVGWGYGSNMLTKYLSEAGDETSVTASVCIDNPFDLDEFTRSYPHRVVLDQKSTYGMVDILHANKEMFQGKNKGFDVSKGLSATSIREFDQAISMISHGFKDIREFYSKSSTSHCVSSLRIPLLFIQIDERMVPLLSIPRNSIEENPFTSLLMCSSLSSIVNRTERSELIRGQYLAIEWLQAVELALMKGRHPLLEDVDIALNPSYDFPSPGTRKILPQGSKIKGEPLATGDKSENGNCTSEIPKSICMKRYSKYAINQMVEQSKDAGQGASDREYPLTEETNTNSSSVKDTSLDVKANSDDLSSDDNSNALSTAAVVLNMLDATVQGNLNDEQKRKVLAAVGQGETLIKALQEAVPEEVRGKLISAASHIVESQRSILNLDGLIKLGCIPNVKLNKKSKTDEGSIGTSIEVDGFKDLQDNVTDDEMQTCDSLFVQSSAKSTTREGVTSQVNATQNSEASDMERNLMKTDSSREVHAFNEVIAGEDKVIQSHEGDGAHKDDQLVAEASNCHAVKEVSEYIGDSSGDSSLEKEETKEDQKQTEDGQSEVEQKVIPEGPSSLSAINVSEALDAFRSFDDSTQMAVNSVFGVIENMIDQLEKKTDQNAGEEKKEEHPQAQQDITDKDLKIGNKSRDKTTEARSNAKEEDPNPKEATRDSHTNKIGHEKTEDLTHGLSLKLEDTELSDNMIDQLEKKTDQNAGEEKKEEHPQAQQDITDKDLKIGNKSRDKTTEARSNAKEDPNPKEATRDSHTNKIGHEKTEDLTHGLSLKLEDTELSDNLGKNPDTYAIANDEHLKRDKEKESASDCQDIGGAHYEMDNEKDPAADTYAITCDKHLKRDNEKESASDCQDSGGAHSTDARGDENAWSYPRQLLHQANWESSYRAYISRYFLSQLSHMQSVDAQSVTDLFLDTENGQWKMLGQPENDKCSLQEIRKYANTNENGQNLNSVSVTVDQDILFKPSYPIPDKNQAKLEGQSKAELDTISNYVNREGFLNITKEKLTWLVKNAIQEILKVEVRRSLGIPDTDIDSELVYDIDNVANVVSYSIFEHSNILLSSDDEGLQDGDMTFPIEDEGARMMFGTVQGQVLIGTISSAVRDTNHLREILPIGVIVGSSLASLRKYFNISDVSDNKQNGTIFSGDVLEKFDSQGADIKDRSRSIDKEHRNASSYDEGNRNLNNIDSHNSDMIVGALTVAMCAPALLACVQKDNSQKSYGRIKPGPSNEGNGHKAKDKDEMKLQDIDQSNLVSNIAEKAMSVAAPVVPTKNDGELDEERLVNILTELGQKGGILKFLGNIALLWGGIRGAMSLTDRLIRFLRIAERPLFQRVLCFVCMTLLMWSPVAIPLLPKIVQSWTAKTSAGISAYACVAGFHVAILILIMLWGKRIRGYDYPLKQYGLSLSTTSKLQEFVKGLIGGTLLVLAVHFTNVSLGYAYLVRPSNFSPYSAGTAIVVKEYGKLILFFIREILLATSVATMEELLFRSWLPDEISVDLGHHMAVVLSGLAFALFQRSLSSMPSLLFLSLALLGAKQRANGSLYVSIGLRTGIMLSSFMIKDVGFIIYKSSAPFWLTNSHSWHPFDGVVGLCFCVVLALFLYPRQFADEGNAQGSVGE